MEGNSTIAGYIKKIKEVGGFMIGFVILHYKNLNDTLEAIASIRKNTSKKNKIIVVDNASLNSNDAKVLSKRCDELIINSENLGFAKANNIGCKKAIEKYSPDFLCVINNDILICQKHFDEKIRRLYEETSFDILGPKILTDGGDSVNPFPVYQTDDEVIHAIKNAKMWIHIYRNPQLRYLYRFYKKIKPSKKQVFQNGKKRTFQVGLHGCALVFSKKYYQKYADVFYPDTFLYHEEEFLYERAKRDQLIMMYDPEIEVFHKEGASLDQSFSVPEEKMIFRYTEMIRSLEKLLEYKKNIIRRAK